MFHLYQSHSLEKLAQHFIERAGEALPENPLDQPWIIVQNNEIKEWLSLKFASRQGIAGNFRFIFPSEFLWVLYRLKKPDVSQQLPGDLNAMQWGLFELLSEEPDLLKDIPMYHSGSDSIQNRFHFCARVADNFDQYQMYRPAMMEGWLRGRASTKSRHEKWQMQLWQRLNKRWQASPKTRGIPRRSGAFMELSRWLKSDEDFLKQLPKELYVFGLSHAAKPFIEITALISKSKSLHYFLRYSEFRGESEESDLPAEIQQKWSKPLREQSELITAITAQAEVPLKQEDVGEEERGVIKPTVHACHNKRREAEVLKDEILDFLDSHPECSVEDVLVMVPDAQEYAGILEAVFANDEQEPALPVARLLGSDRESVSHALSQLLELLTSDFKASAVLQFLQLEPVRERFDFSESELDTLEEWTVENQVFWGLGESFNERYSWQKGINQLVAGYSMETPQKSVFKGLIPCEAVTSSDDAELSARFSGFLNALKQAKEQASVTRTAEDWIDCSTQWLKTFMGATAASDAQFTRLQVLLAKLKEQAELAQSQQKVSFGLMKNWLQTQLDSQDSVTARYGQGIRVSSYVPYRSVPFGFIGVLGMNEDVFPRKAVRPEFDLIYEDPKPGDRMLKEDDTCLFLEILESAQKHLHISYQAFAQRSDAQRLPSILVQQLMEQLHEEPAREIRTHHLHAFNAGYFTSGGNATYSSFRKELAEKMKGDDKKLAAFLDESLVAEANFGQEVISLKDLNSFFTHPSKFFVQNILSLHNYDNFVEVSDREPFKLNGLEGYNLKTFLAESFLQDIPEGQLYDYASSYPLIPESLQGKKEFKERRHQVANYIETVKQYTSVEEQQVEIDLEASGVRLQGRIGGLYENKLVHYRPASRKPKHEIGWWLQAMWLLKAGVPLETLVYISLNTKNEPEVLDVPVADLTSEWLDEALAWALRAEPWLHKLCFFPETSRAYTDEFRREEYAEAAAQQARREWEPNYGPVRSESEDFYNDLIWKGRNFFGENYFHENALRIWEPFLAFMEEQGND